MYRYVAARCYFMIWGNFYDTMAWMWMKPEETLVSVASTGTHNLDWRGTMTVLLMKVLPGDVTMAAHKEDWASFGLLSECFERRRDTPNGALKQRTSGHLGFARQRTVDHGDDDEHAHGDCKFCMTS